MTVTDKKRDQIIKDVTPMLNAGEQVLDATTCLAEVLRLGTKTSRRATLAVTDRRIIIFSKKLGGYDVQDFAYGLLASVDHKKGMMFGNIDLRAAGDGIHLQQVDKNEVERIAQAIRDRMLAAHDHKNSPAPSAISVADEIRKLASLRVEGLISAEQFETKKGQLLGI